MDASASVIREGLCGPLAELGVDLEDVQVQRSGRRQVVRVVVDRDGGVDLDVVAEVSRRVGDLLEEGPLASALAGPYVLEVSSPGVDRPLTEPRHWRRAAGRLVRMELVDGTVIEGRVVAAPAEVLTSDGACVRVDVDGEVRTWDRASVARAVVQVDFRRTDAPADEPADEPAEESAHQSEEET